MTAFDWRDCLILARDRDKPQAPTCLDETRWRAAIGRAYYSAFCPARDFLIARGEISPARQDEPRLHADVASRFKSKQDGGCKKIGMYLSTLRDSRNRADYERTVGGLREMAAQALRYAQWIHEFLDRLSPSTPPTPPAAPKSPG
ncbi:MAG: HEPN domain-containing protein [Deltaproteobacteria bacterium]|nr:HEPN domain-containing protein [Deltaproteobacteria bacterium]